MQWLLPFDTGRWLGNIAQGKVSGIYGPGAGRFHKK
jgi:hypothetical protein